MTMSHQTVDDTTVYHFVRNSLNRARKQDHHSGHKDGAAFTKSLPPGSKTLKVLACTTLLVVPLFVLIWIPVDANRLLHTDILKGIYIGGSLTLSQAKAVDFVSSAVLAPLILSASNYIWFANARASMVNDRTLRTRGVSLYTLVEASGTSIDSYNVFKIWTLFRSASLSLGLLACLTVLAALAQSSLSNFVAYEAFLQEVDGPRVALRLLKWPQVVAPSIEEPDANPLFSVVSSAQQRRSWSKQLNKLNSMVRLHNTTSFLEHGAYIAPNATKKTLESATDATTMLRRVPALRATVQCTPHTPESLNWTTRTTSASITFDGQPNVSSSGWRGDVSDNFNNSFYEIPDNTSLNNGIAFPFVASNYNNTSVYAGIIATNITEGQNIEEWVSVLSQPIQSPFGEVRPKAFNLTNFQTNKTKPCNAINSCIAIIFGIVCTIEQQSGVVDLERLSDKSAWISTRPAWNNDSTQLILPRLEEEDTVDLVFSSAWVCGDDPDLTEYPECNVLSKSRTDVHPGHWNLQTLAHNMLYLNMEYERIGLEAAASDTNISVSDSDSTSFVSVPSVANVQKYRMTYVPALLVAGLVFFFLAALVTIFMMILSRRSSSNDSKCFRIVDSLRLLVDTVNVLRWEGIQHQAAEWTHKELEAWAKEFVVRYEPGKGFEHVSEQTSIEVFSHGSSKK